jgi:hypothetical protein
MFNGIVFLNAAVKGAYRDGMLLQYTKVYIM